MRPGEVDGEDYHFVSDEGFQQRLVRGEFVEWAEVYDYRYGATVDAATRALSGGGAMLVDVDVQGAETWKRVLEDQCVTVFVLPPSIEVLRGRLEGRRTEEDRALRRRMENARKELERADRYDYTIVNDDLATAICDLRAIVRAERQRSWRMASILGQVAEPSGPGSTT
jgi:guanylate kinase